MRLGPEVDLAFVSAVAEEQHLAAVGDQDQRIVGKGHGRFLLISLPRRTRTRAGWLRQLAAINPPRNGEGDQRSRRRGRRAGFRPPPSALCPATSPQPGRKLLLLRVRR